MAPTQGLLQNRAILIGILLACSYETVALWVTITKYSGHPYTLGGVFGLAVAAFIAASITYRSRFFADRVVFGPIAVICVLTAARMTHLNSVAMLIVKTAEAVMWTIAAAVSVVVLLRGFKASHKSN
jgi:O-antigen/teichoic acid export membrane protein